jgi:hypothetical protein
LVQIAISMTLMLQPPSRLSFWEISDLVPNFCFFFPGTLFLWFAIRSFGTNQIKSNQERRPVELSLPPLPHLFFSLSSPRPFLFVGSVSSHSCPTVCWCPHYSSWPSLKRTLCSDLDCIHIHRPAPSVAI